MVLVNEQRVQPVDELQRRLAEEIGAQSPGDQKVGVADSNKLFNDAMGLKALIGVQSRGDKFSDVINSLLSAPIGQGGSLYSNPGKRPVVPTHIDSALILFMAEDNDSGDNQIKVAEKESELATIAGIDKNAGKLFEERVEKDRGVSAKGDEFLFMNGAKASNQQLYKPSGTKVLEMTEKGERELSERYMDDYDNAVEFRGVVADEDGGVHALVWAPVQYSFYTIDTGVKVSDRPDLFKEIPEEKA